jgi:hypothetical protein
MPRKKKVEKTEEPIVVESTAIEIVKPEALLIPENTINIPVDEYRQLQRPSNPLPWIAVFMVIFAGAIVGAMVLGINLTRPSVTIVPTNFPTSTFIPTVTLTNTPTQTPIPTVDPIPERVRVLYDYYEYLSVGDYNGAWDCLTLKFRRNAFSNNFEDFKDNWSRIGPVGVSEIVYEKGNTSEIQLRTKLYFYYEQKLRYYRFYLLYNPISKVWQIDSVDPYTNPW